MPPKKKKIHFSSLKELNESTVSTSVIAALTGKSIRAVERNSDPNDKNYMGLQTVGRGQYRTGDAWRRLHEHNKNKIEELQGGTLRNSKERISAAAAEKAELDLKEKKDEVIEVGEAIELFEKLFSNYTSRVNTTRKLSVPKLLMAKDDKEASQIIQARDNELAKALLDIINEILRPLFVDNIK